MATDTSTIRAGAEIFTLINVFSVAPDRQQELATLLIEAVASRFVLPQDSKV